MKIEAKTEVDPKEEVKESETLPEVTETPVEEKPNDAAKKLELENAELKGKVSAFETISKSSPKVDQPNNQEVWKNQALQDSNTLNDEEFQTKYKYNKLEVTRAILQYEFTQQTTQQKTQFAELRAENQMIAKHSDFWDYKDAIKEAVEDVSPEVKQDPERLAKVMERAYLAASKDKPKGKEPMQRSQITSNFERPTPKDNSQKKTSDEIPAEYAERNKKFGITSEKERQALIATDDCETDFGAGYVLRDRAKGFEKVA